MSASKIHSSSRHLLIRQTLVSLNGEVTTQVSKFLHGVRVPHARLEIEDNLTTDVTLHEAMTKIRVEPEHARVLVKQDADAILIVVVLLNKNLSQVNAGGVTSLRLRKTQFLTSSHAQSNLVALVIRASRNGHLLDVINTVLDNLVVDATNVVIHPAGVVEETSNLVLLVVLISRHSV